MNSEKLRLRAEARQKKVLQAQQDRLTRIAPSAEAPAPDQPSTGAPIGVTRNDFSLECFYRHGVAETTLWRALMCSSVLGGILSVVWEEIFCQALPLAPWHIAMLIGAAAILVLRILPSVLTLLVGGSNKDQDAMRGAGGVLAGLDLIGRYVGVISRAMKVALHLFLFFLSRAAAQTIISRCKTLS
uniref:Uncharacterized protein n=1 Tax=Vitrella brassicaformis TaxID=1169539 RepID=A0A7S1JMN3_9ALVE|mmetsp:Transcript_14531/g.34671  ORF Transcript_14531/g.34671 Transcript_14531/m.34671 type:complete len:186 (+) Transcript_14531:104-661(+)